MEAENNYNKLVKKQEEVKQDSTDSMELSSVVSDDSGSVVKELSIHESMQKRHEEVMMSQ